MNDGATEDVLVKSPPSPNCNRTILHVSHARKLVESDEVLLIFNSLGTPPNTAIQKYMNSNKVPQLFIATGATKWNDPQNFPWTMGWQPNYQSETQVYAKYILKKKPDAKIAVLFQNDDYGKDFSSRYSSSAATISRARTS